MAGMLQKAGELRDKSFPPGSSVLKMDGALGVRISMDFIFITMTEKLGFI